MLRDLLQALLGVAVFPLCFVAPGYVVGWATRILGFRSHSVPERILWAIAFSGPLSTVLTSIGGRFLSPATLLGIFVGLGAVAIALLVIDLRHSRGSLQFGTEFRVACAAMALVVAYCLLATLGIQTQHSLYEGTLVADWSVRIPLVEAATSGGIPPHNPLFALAGNAPPMRYYYFWYELCAQAVRLTHIPARAALIASTVWAAVSLVAILFLYLKYMATPDTSAPIFLPSSASPDMPPPPRVAALRRICLTALFLCCIMSLFLINVFFTFLRFPRAPRLDLEFWFPDRMPSWIGAILFAPHHIAGLAFGATGFLLLALLPPSRRQQIAHALLAAICFAALAGTSTYLALCFGFAGLFLFLVKLRLRLWNQIAMLALCAVAAVLIARPFLHEMTSNTGYSASEHPTADQKKSLVANSMFKLVLRDWHTAYGQLGWAAPRLHIPFLHEFYRFPVALAYLPLIYFIELGLFTFVLWYQFKIDFLRRRPGLPSKPGPIPERALLLWALFLGFAFPAMFLSSEPTQGINDLGRHAGLALRFSLILWAAPMFANTRLRLRSGATPTRAGRWVLAITSACIVLGLCGQLWQTVMGRIYIPLAAHNVIDAKLLYLDRAPFLGIRDANQAVDAALPPSALIQSNPEGFYQPIFTFYTAHTMAAGDGGCESAFGGNIDLCTTEILPPLHALFGGSIDIPLIPGAPIQLPPDPTQMTDAGFRSVCANMHLSALLATRRDNAWRFPHTWVWQEPTLYADDSVRVLACPTP